MVLAVLMVMGKVPSMAAVPAPVASKVVKVWACANPAVRIVRSTSADVSAIAEVRLRTPGIQLRGCIRSFIQGSPCLLRAGGQCTTEPQTGTEAKGGERLGLSGRLGVSLVTPGLDRRSAFGLQINSKVKDGADRTSALHFPLHTPPPIPGGDGSQHEAASPRCVWRCSRRGRR